jgi:hypothetical protein
MRYLNARAKNNHIHQPSLNINSTKLDDLACIAKVFYEISMFQLNAA